MRGLAAHDGNRADQDDGAAAANIRLPGTLAETNEPMSCPLRRNPARTCALELLDLRLCFGRDTRSLVGVDLQTANPGADRLRRPGPEHSRDSGHRRVLARIVGPHLGDHADSALTKLARYLLGRPMRQILPRNSASGYPGDSMCREHYNTVRLHGGIGYVTPTTDTQAGRRTSRGVLYITEYVWAPRGFAKRTSCPISAICGVSALPTECACNPRLPLGRIRRIVRIEAPKVRGERDSEQLCIVRFRRESLCPIPDTRS